MSNERLRENSEIRRAQVAAFTESGMCAKDWCAKNNVSESTLRYWKRKLREEGSATGAWVDLSSLANSNCTAIVPVGHGTVTIRVGAFVIEATRDSDILCLKGALSACASLC